MYSWESFLFWTVFKSQDTFRIGNYLTHFLTVQLLGVRPLMVSDPEQKTLIALHVVMLLVLWRRINTNLGILKEPDDVEVQANVTANPSQPYTVVDDGFT